MPTGPKGEKRPADTVANVLLVAKLAIGEAEEAYVDQGKRKGGQKGGKARAESMSKEERSRVARKGAKARWD